MSHLLNQKNKHNHQHSARGFSLVELLVSLSVFSVVMTISIGTLLIMIDANAKAQALASATTNLSFALDNITREIRTGYHYYCSTNINLDPEDVQDQTHDCTSGTPGNFISFVRERDGVQVGYKLENGVIYGNSDDSNLGWLALTSNQIVIDRFDIVAYNTLPYAYYSGSTYTTNSASGYADQPVVDLYITGHINNGLDDATTFSIQSHMVQHRLDTL